MWVLQLLLAAGSLTRGPLGAADAKPAGFEAPSAPWRTAQTEHVVLYYPQALAEWGRHLAAQIEPIHEEVAAVVGYHRKTGAEKIVVVAADPIAAANGMASPLLKRPFVVVLATPPASDPGLEDYRDWGEMVLSHELGHILHLTRPRHRKPGVFDVDPFGPLDFAPRWVTEGYATVIEGKLTGSGRPRSVWRAALLRRWASSGRLPTYRAMSSSRDWVGDSYAYLVGSAFLEWLEAREGKGSLLTLWKSVTRKRSLPFKKAFVKTFGRPPEELHDRFTAELTASAISEEKRLKAAGLFEGETWQRFEGGTESPQVSPDGSRLVLVRRPPEREGELDVFTLEPAEAEKEKRKKHEEEEKKRLEDLEEPRDFPETPLPREPQHRLKAVDHFSPRGPRWMPDGKRILFVRKSADPYGVLRNDLWIWTVDTGAVERLTRFEDLRMADPLPDGRRAIAVRQRFGRSGLVTVDLGSGEVRPLALIGLESDLFDVFTDPRVSPDGRALVVAWHHAGEWRLVRVDLEGSHAARPIDLGSAHPSGAAAWSASGQSVFVATDRDAVWNIEEVPPEGRPLTRAFGGALDPAPTPDGESIFFLSVTPNGVDVNRLSLPPPPLPALPPETISARAAHPLYPPAPRPAAPSPLSASLPVESPYDTLKATRIQPFGAGSSSPSGQQLVATVGGNDVVGRLAWNVAAGLATRGETSGAAAALRWEGWRPAEVSLRIFAVRERPGGMTRESRPERDRDRLGGELLLERSRLWDHGAHFFSGGVLAERIEPRTVGGLGRALARAAGALSFKREQEGWGLSAESRLAGAIGRSSGAGWRLGRAALEVGVLTPGGSLLFSVEEGRVSGTPSRFDLFTIGSLEGTLGPSADALFRAEAPALPGAILTGERLGIRRLEYEPVEFVALYCASFRAAGGVDALPFSRVRVAGAEVRFAIPSQPLLPVGGRARLALGAARIFDAPLEDRTVAYVSFSIRP